jgi:CheY-like chemotaxis protein
VDLLLTDVVMQGIDGSLAEPTLQKPFTPSVLIERVRHQLDAVRG